MNNISVTKYLIEKGANINLRNFSYLDRTPLQIAAVKGNLDICCLLVSYGAKINCLDLDDKTALMLALSRRNFAVAEFLLLNKAVHHPSKKKEEYLLLLEDLIRKFTPEETATMKLFFMLCNHAFKQSNTLKSTCRYSIMEYDCQGKLSVTAIPLNIPERLKYYLAFEEELRALKKKKISRLGRML